MMARPFPKHFFRTILQPICKCHIAMSEIDSIVSPSHRRHGILLRQDEAHNLGQFDVLQEKLDMQRIGGIQCRLVHLILNKVILTKHLNVGVIRIYADWPS